MSGVTSVASLDRPPVAGLANSAAASSNDRLDRDYQTLGERLTEPGSVVVGDIRLLVDATTDAVPGEIAAHRIAAGDRDVRIAGGAETIQEYLDSGLIDEFSITLAPVLFGTGIRLFNRVDVDRLVLDQVRAEASSRVTHLTYAAVKR